MPAISAKKKPAAPAAKKLTSAKPAPPAATTPAKPDPTTLMITLTLPQSSATERPGTLTITRGKLGTLRSFTYQKPDDFTSLITAGVQALMKLEAQPPQVKAPPPAATPAALLQPPTTKPAPPAALEAANPHADLIGRQFLDEEGRLIHVTGLDSQFPATHVRIEREGQQFGILAERIRTFSAPPAENEIPAGAPPPPPPAVDTPPPAPQRLKVGDVFDFEDRRYQLTKVEPDRGDSGSLTALDLSMNGAAPPLSRIFSNLIGFEQQSGFQIERPASAPASSPAATPDAAQTQVAATPAAAPPVEDLSPTDAAPTLPSPPVAPADSPAAEPIEVAAPPPASPTGTPPPAVEDDPAEIESDDLWEDAPLTVAAPAAPLQPPAPATSLPEQSASPAAPEAPPSDESGSAVIAVDLFWDDPAPPAAPLPSPAAPVAPSNGHAAPHSDLAAAGDLATAA